MSILRTRATVHELSLHRKSAQITLILFQVIFATVRITVVFHIPVQVGVSLSGCHLRQDKSHPETTTHTRLDIATVQFLASRGNYNSTRVFITYKWVITNNILQPIIIS